MRIQGLLIQGLEDCMEAERHVLQQRQSTKPLSTHCYRRLKVENGTLTVNDVTAVAVGIWRSPQYSFPDALRPTTAGPTPAQSLQLAQLGRLSDRQTDRQNRQTDLCKTGKMTLELDA